MKVFHQDYIDMSMQKNKKLTKRKGMPPKGMAGRRSTRTISAVQKMTAIQRVQNGESKASVARDILVPESTLRGWCKSANRIRGMARNSMTPDSEAHSSASSSGTGCNREDVDDMIGPQSPRRFKFDDTGNGSDSGNETAITTSTPIHHHQPHHLSANSQPSTLGNIAPNLPPSLDYLGSLLQGLANNRVRSDVLNTMALHHMMGLASSTNANTGPVGLVENGLQYSKNLNLSANKNSNPLAYGLNNLGNNLSNNVSNINKLNNEISSSRKTLSTPTSSLSTMMEAQTSPVALTSRKSENRSPLPVHNHPTTTIPTLTMNHQQAQPLIKMQSITSISNHQQPPATAKNLVVSSSSSTNVTTSTTNNNSAFYTGLPYVSPTSIANAASKIQSVANISQLQSYDKEFWLWLAYQQHYNKELPVNPQSAKEVSMFWNWYQETNRRYMNVNGTLVPEPVPRPPGLFELDNVRSGMDNVLLGGNGKLVERNLHLSAPNANEEKPITADEAITYGELFFKYLDECSDPVVTRLHVLQLKNMLVNLKSRNMTKSLKRINCRV